MRPVPLPLRPVTLATALALQALVAAAQTTPAAPAEQGATLATVTVEASADASAEGLSKPFAGGQVEPATGDFVFGLSEGYLIENGKATAPVRGATLIGNGIDVLAKIDAIGNDLGMKSGFCGKDGQQVPVGTGQPTVRISELTVGGTDV